MLVLPLTEAAASRALTLVLERNARLVAVGPVRGSFVVEGSRLAAPLAAVGALVVAVPPGGCGERETLV